MYDENRRKGGASALWEGEIRIAAGITEESLGIYSLVSKRSSPFQFTAFCNVA